MSSTRRQDVFKKAVNPLNRIISPRNPEWQPPQYIPRQGRRQVYDFMQRVNVNMHFGNPPVVSMNRQLEQLPGQLTG
jgi:hypothetical protein